ncbi:hypothetical protein [Solidesulfovibrio sp.]|uniref:hypothetical protein n=1 Tax=Solidesulfovibrio sp. TaxID=2910990 RepID=UPI00263687C7|nr:hypothetical protein [Solidesulfovibrio sp.]
MHALSRLLPRALAAALALCLAASAGLAAGGPSELAGIRLGQNVDELSGKLASTTVDRSPQRPSLGVVPVAPLPGFRSGYVDVGLCAKPGRVVRVKLNYADESLAFFNKIMEALKKRYGEPKEWRGNAFGTLRTWKWGLRSPSGEPVSLILMHYEGDDGAFTDGNSIRIAATSMVREEELCRAAEKKISAADEKNARGAMNAEALGLDWFLPR